MSIIRIETENGTVDFRREDTMIYHYDNSIYDHIRQHNGVVDGYERTTHYPLWALGRGILQVADLMVEHQFTSVYLSEPEELVKEMPILHFNKEVEYIEAVLEEWSTD